MKVHAKIQKWGNGLALRISGAMRTLPHLQEGMSVDVVINEDGFTVKKSFVAPLKKLPFTEKELLEGLSAHKAHADLLALPLPNEMEP
jgi:antitoxin MazE